MKLNYKLKCKITCKNVNTIFFAYYDYLLHSVTETYLPITFYFVSRYLLMIMILFKFSVKFSYSSSGVRISVSSEPHDEDSTDAEISKIDFTQHQNEVGNLFRVP